MHEQPTPDRGVASRLGGTAAHSRDLGQRAPTGSQWDRRRYHVRVLGSPGAPEPALRRWGGPVLILWVGLWMLRRTWRTWPDPIVDFGRELYVPWSLLEGQRLYADLA